MVAVTELGQVSIHSFTQFAQNMKSTFGATVTPTKSSEHQVFAFKDSQLGFIPISTEDSLLTRRDTFTDLAINKIETIIAKESIVRHCGKCQMQCLTGGCGIAKSQMHVKLVL